VPRAAVGSPVHGWLCLQEAGHGPQPMGHRTHPPWSACRGPAGRTAPRPSATAPVVPGAAVPGSRSWEIFHGRRGRPTGARQPRPQPPPPSAGTPAASMGRRRPSPRRRVRGCPGAEACKMLVVLCPRFVREVEEHHPAWRWVLYGLGWPAAPAAPGSGRPASAATHRVEPLLERLVVSGAARPKVGSLSSGRTSLSANRRGRAGSSSCPLSSSINVPGLDLCAVLKTQAERQARPVHTPRRLAALGRPADRQ